MSEEYEDDLVIHPFEDRMTFTMPENYVNWSVIDEFSNADPSSKQYRRLMKELRITGKLNGTRSRRSRRWDDADWE